MGTRRKFFSEGYRYRTVAIVGVEEDEAVEWYLRKLYAKSTDADALADLAEYLRSVSDGSGPVTDECPYENDGFEVVLGDTDGVYVLSFEIGCDGFAALTEIVDQES